MSAREWAADQPSNLTDCGRSSHCVNPRSTTQALLSSPGTPGARRRPRTSTHAHRCRLLGLAIAFAAEVVNWKGLESDRTAHAPAEPPEDGSPGVRPPLRAAPASVSRSTQGGNTRLLGRGRPGMLTTAVHGNRRGRRELRAQAVHPIGGGAAGGGRLPGPPAGGRPAAAVPARPTYAPPARWQVCTRASTCAPLHGTTAVR